MNDWADILDFEAQHQTTPRRAKIRAIHATFGIGEGAYTYRLHRAIDHVDALAYRPVLVARLRRDRDDKHTKRTEGVRA